jgi:hypothetical protein
MFGSSRIGDLWPNELIAVVLVLPPAVACGLSILARDRQPVSDLSPHPTPAAQSKISIGATDCSRPVSQRSNHSCPTIVAYSPATARSFGGTGRRMKGHVTPEWFLVSTV